MQKTIFYLEQVAPWLFFIVILLLFLIFRIWAKAHVTKVVEDYAKKVEAMEEHFEEIKEVNKHLF